MLSRILRRIPLQSGTLREEVHDTLQSHPAASKGGLWAIAIASLIMCSGWLISEPLPPEERALKLWLTEKAEILPWTNPSPYPEPLLEMTMEEFKGKFSSLPYAVLYNSRWHESAWEQGVVFVNGSGWQVQYLGQLGSGVWIIASEQIPGRSCMRFECETTFDRERGVFTFAAGERISWDSFLRRTKTTLFILGFVLLSYARRFRRKHYVTWRDAGEWAIDPRTWM